MKAKKLVWIQLMLALFQLDLAVKHEIDTNPAFARGQELFGGRVTLRRLHNHGMAGGGLKGHMPEIIGASGLVTGCCLVRFLLLLREDGHAAGKAGYALLTGGALSNLYDRCRKGYVTDYISFRTPVKPLNNLVFNLSDFFIFAGAALGASGKR